MFNEALDNSGFVRLRHVSDVQSCVLGLIVVKVWIVVGRVVDQNTSVRIVTLADRIDTLAKPYCEGVIDPEVIPDGKLQGKKYLRRLFTR